VFVSWLLVIYKARKFSSPHPDNNSDMRLDDSLKTNLTNLNSDYQIGDRFSQGSNLLTQLEDRVHQTLSAKNSGNLIDPQLVKNYIAEISNTPQPGMIIQNTIV